MEDADYVIVAIGSTAGNARHVARELRAQGVKAGVLKIRVFRPFPFTEIAEALKGAKAVAVLDRSESFGAEGGPLFLEVRSALYDLEKRPTRRQLHLRPRRCGREARTHPPGLQRPGRPGRRRDTSPAGSSTSAHGREENQWQTSRSSPTRGRRLAGGHRLCAGCGASIAVRQIMLGGGRRRRSSRVARPAASRSRPRSIPYTSWTDPVHPQRLRELGGDDLRRRGGVQGPEGAPARSPPTSASSSSRSAATAAPTTSVCSRCPAPWSAATTWSTSATTTART